LNSPSNTAGSTVNVSINIYFGTDVLPQLAWEVPLTISSTGLIPTVNALNSIYSFKELDEPLIDVLAGRGSKFNFFFKVPGSNGGGSKYSLAIDYTATVNQVDICLVDIYKTGRSIVCTNEPITTFTTNSGVKEKSFSYLGLICTKSKFERVFLKKNDDF
jgi:hypothetical protein